MKATFYEIGENSFTIITCKALELFLEKSIFSPIPTSPAEDRSLVSIYVAKQCITISLSEGNLKIKAVLVLHLCLINEYS